MGPGTAALQQSKLFASCEELCWSGEDLPPVKLTWHQGESKPEIWTSGGIPKWDSGCLFIGSKGMLLADYSKHVLLPEKEFEGFQPPAPTLPPSPGHHEEWLQACKTGRQASANFEYSGWLTEARIAL